MNKKELLEHLKAAESLSEGEKKYLVDLINSKKKYGLVWEDKPEAVEDQLRTHLSVLREVKDRAIINEDNNENAEKKPNHTLIERSNQGLKVPISFLS